MKKLLSLVFLSALLAACGGKNDGAGKADSAGGSASNNEIPGSTSGGGTTGAGTTDGGTTSGAATGKGMYTAESGIIEMKSDAMGDMTITTYFKDHGATRATHTMVEMMGQKTGSVSVEKDGFVTSYDLSTKQGTKRKMAPGAAGGATGMGGAMPDMSQISSMSAEDKAKYKYAELENRSVAGKEGKGYAMEMSGMKMKVWVWDNIPLRMEMEMGGPKPMIIEASKIETDVPVPDDKFAIPADVKITES